MSQLIALIIAIALGAIVTAIGYVFLGDAFTSNSERGIALQLVNQGSQIEMAMTAFRASNAVSAFDTNYATTMVDGSNNDGLVDLGFVKETIVSPIESATYALMQDTAGQDTFLVLDGANLSNAVCLEIEDLAGRELADASALTALAGTIDGDAAEGVLTSRYGCYDSDAGNVFVYEVE